MPIVSGVLGLIGITGAGSAVVGPLLDKAAEKLFNSYGKEILEDIQARLRAYTGKVPINHDLEHVIRVAELTSTLFLLETYRRQDEDDHFDDRAYQLPSFIKAARKWLHDQLGLSWQMSLIPNDTLIHELERQLDQSLSARKREELRASLKEAQRQVWCDLIAGAQSGEPPSEFAKIFFGNDTDQPGWSVTFLAFMREVLKKNSRAEVAFVTSRLSGALEVMRRIEATLTTFRGDVLDNMTALREGVSELLAIARQNDLRRRAAHDGVPGTTIQPKIKYFDTRARDVIRSKFSIYREEHQIGLPELVRRIEEQIDPPQELSIKTLKRFMKGIRVDDSFVALLTYFADTIATPSVPEVVPVLDNVMQVELAINDRAETIIFFPKPFSRDLLWLEFNSDTNWLRFILEGGYSPGIPVKPELGAYVRRSHRVLMVRVDEETNEPIGGNYFPLLVLKFDRAEDSPKDVGGVDLAAAK